MEGTWKWLTFSSQRKMMAIWLQCHSYSGSPILPCSCSTHKNEKKEEDRKERGKMKKEEKTVEENTPSSHSLHAGQRSAEVKEDWRLLPPSSTKPQTESSCHGGVEWGQEATVMSDGGEGGRVRDNNDASYLSWRTWQGLWRSIMISLGWLECSLCLICHALGLCQLVNSSILEELSAFTHCASAVALGGISSMYKIRDLPWS